MVATAARISRPLGFLLRVMAIRTGERSFSETIVEIEHVEQCLEATQHGPELPTEPERSSVNRFLTETYRHARGWQRRSRQRFALVETRSKERPRLL